jgi:Fe-S-cluster-containing dehydrogenase component
MVELELAAGHDHDHGDCEGDGDFSRRAFLKLAGFAFTGAMVGGCQRAPVQNAIPPLTQPEGVVPGRALYYASTCGGCNAGCGTLVKTRDGRPIKLEGSPSHALSLGGLCAAGQASILGLYDSSRLQRPLKKGEDATWAAVDADIKTLLQDLRRQGKKVRLLSGTVTSPTTLQAISEFLATFSPNARHIVYDPFSCSAIREAHFQTHGTRVVPRYRLEMADVIVSFDTDFLGTWLSPVQFAAGYQAGRYLQGPAPTLSYHVQFESRLSLSGTKADQRVCIAPGEIGLAMTSLARRVAQKAGRDWGSGEIAEPPVPAGFLDDLAERLWRARGRSVVLCGSQEIGEQLVCNLLNDMLGNYGATVDVAQPSYQNQSNDQDLQDLLEEIRQGQVGALFLYRSNPLYDLPLSQALKTALSAVPLLVSFSSVLDETAKQAQYVCPEPHYLESWNDAEAVDGVVSLFQPAIQPLGDSRSLLETLAVWMARPRSAYDQLRDYWQARIYPRSLVTIRFAEFWNQSVHDGSVRVSSQLSKVRPFSGDVAPIRQARQVANGSYSLVLYAKVGMPTGGHAYNPWLQELPDPITKITWDNYASLAPSTAAQLGINQGDVVRLETTEAGGETLELPAVIQPGQHGQVVAVALGYGSRLSERFAQVGPPWLEAGPTLGANGMVGVNAAPLIGRREGTFSRTRQGLRLVKTERRQTLACTQEQPLIRVPLPVVLGREPEPIIKETTLAAYVRPAQAAPPVGERESLWPDDHQATGSRWGLAIDLNACTGCSACVVACQVENNIPVVGKDEVARHREMHWLRIDRYYSNLRRSPVDGGPRKETEVDVAHQPMLCQHCGNAPCEVVCPVLATVHSEEGLNQQVYNRCVGTRYCANNCPYKVRRFNWFDYAHDDQLENLVLNPDVTVRSRGVMEKCTLCVQRIQEAKIEARRLGHPLADGDIQTACQQSCPTKAIVFGDLNNARSQVALQSKSRRAYHVLEELNVESAVSYLTIIRNRPADAGQGG